jgi:hypothetical protein
MKPTKEDIKGILDELKYVNANPSMSEEDLNDFAISIWSSVTDSFNERLDAGDREYSKADLDYEVDNARFIGACHEQFKLLKHSVWGKIKDDKITCDYGTLTKPEELKIQKNLRVRVAIIPEWEVTVKK